MPICIGVGTILNWGWAQTSAQRVWARNVFGRQRTKFDIGQFVHLVL